MRVARIAAVAAGFLPLEFDIEIESIGARRERGRRAVERFSNAAGNAKAPTTVPWHPRGRCDGGGLLDTNAG